MQVARKKTQVPQQSGIGSATTQPPPPDLEEHGPRYVFMNELGRGGMGRVDEVFDNMLGRSIAQKCALPDGGEAYATMLVSEAQTCAQLEHPAIVPVYDIASAPRHAVLHDAPRPRPPRSSKSFATSTSPRRAPSYSPSFVRFVSRSTTRTRAASCIAT